MFSEGQTKIRSASVVVVGAGGLGCPALQYLGAAGLGRKEGQPLMEEGPNFFFLGRISIVDHDRVELSNLQRQILHSEETIGMYKAESAALALKRYVVCILGNLHTHFLLENQLRIDY